MGEDGGVPATNTAMPGLPASIVIGLAFAPLLVQRSWRHTPSRPASVVSFPGRRTVANVLRIIGDVHVSDDLGLGSTRFRRRAVDSFWPARPMSGVVVRKLF